MSSVENWRIRAYNHVQDDFIEWIDSEGFKQMLNDENSEGDNHFVFR